MGLMDLLLKRELQARVVHRLPGRLRLHLPALKRLHSTQGDMTAILEEYVSLPEGIESVSVNSHSASLLISYDSEVLSEEDVLARIDLLGSRVRQHWSTLMNLDPNKDQEKILGYLLDEEPKKQGP